jgi:hypothetical protein
MKVKVFSESMYLIKKGCSFTTAIPILANSSDYDYPKLNITLRVAFWRSGGIGDILPLPQDIIHLETLRYDTIWTFHIQAFSELRPS